MALAPNVAEPEPVEQTFFAGAKNFGPAPGIQAHIKCYKKALIFIPKNVSKV
jgi:hypothetical protein